jgi:hypothetical protein
MSDEERPPVVFVSYSHDSPAHKRWVAALAGRLVENGIDVILDQWNLAPGADLPHFMEQGAHRADRVLVICTEAYVRKADARYGGVGFEAMIVSAELIRNVGSTRFIAIVRQSPGSVVVPIALSTKMYIDFSDDASFEPSFEQLVRELHGAPALRKPPLGKNPFSGRSAPVTATSAPHSAGMARPATIRIPKKHTDAERDAFMEEAFDLMATSFEAWLGDLQRDNSHVKARFRRIDARQFSSVVYRDGEAMNRCRVRLNLGGRGLGTGITYSSDDSDAGTSFNESLSIESDGQALFLRALGLAHFSDGVRGRLTAEQAVNLYWELLISPLRS